MNDNPTFTIPKEIIGPIVEAQISSAILNALGDKQSIVASAVNQVLNEKVDPDSGQKSRYSSDNTVPWFKWMMIDCVRKAAQEAFEEYLSKNKDMVKSNIMSELQKTNSPLAKQLINGMLDAIAHENIKYHIRVEARELR